MKTREPELPPIIRPQIMAKMTLQQAFELALQHHQNGRLGEAEALYLQILAAQPLHPETLHFLGIVSLQRGHNQAALAYFDQALSVRPVWPDALSNRGEALRAEGRLDEAVAAYQRAITLNPRFPQAYNNLGNTLISLGNHEQALASYQKAIELLPEYVDAYNNLGGALKKLGRLEESAAAYRRAIAAQPGNFQALSNLGTVLKEIGQLDKAIDILKQAIALSPDYPEAHYNLGNALKQKGFLDEAITAYRRVIALKPDFDQVHTNLGVALSERGLLGEAINSHRQAISLHADDAKAHCNLGGCLKELGRFDEAILAYRQALAIQPGLSEAHSNLLFAMLHQDLDDREIADEHLLWQRQHADGPTSPRMETLPADERNTKRLRIGYVSPDFREHSVTRFLLPLMENHDREKFEVFAYAEVPTPDEITTRLQSLTDGWRDTVGLGDAQVAELIREDGIDILVDLAGHTAGNRLLVFARQPAPVQVTWLGYPGTTGLDAMTHRLTDAHADPPGLTEDLHSESLVRLPHSAWCFSAIDSPAIIPRPQRGVVFGCFNNFAKVTDPIVQLWAQILATVPDSLILLKSSAFAEKATCEHVRGLFQNRGIAPERILLKGRTPSQIGHLALYHEMDIALDTMPYHGTTTTCEALWMGVPVVTLAGTSHRSRVGVSLLTNVGLEQLIAKTPEEYVRIAASLAGDIPALEVMRSSLRERMLASPLMDGPRFARDIENAYQTMWQDRRTSATSLMAP